MSSTARHWRIAKVWKRAPVFQYLKEVLIVQSLRVAQENKSKLSKISSSGIFRVPFKQTENILHDKLFSTNNGDKALLVCLPDDSGVSKQTHELSPLQII